MASGRLCVEEAARATRAAVAIGDAVASWSKVLEAADAVLQASGKGALDKHLAEILVGLTRRDVALLLHLASSSVAVDLEWRASEPLRYSQRSDGEVKKDGVPAASVELTLAQTARPFSLCVSRTIIAALLEEVAIGPESEKAGKAALEAMKKVLAFKKTGKAVLDAMEKVSPNWSAWTCEVQPVYDVLFSHVCVVCCVVSWSVASVCAGEKAYACMLSFVEM